MQCNRRRALAYIGSATAVLGGWRSAHADDAEKGLTQAHYNAITRTQNSVPGNPPNDPKVPVTPIHNLGTGEKRDLKAQGHAVKRIDGETWNAESPEERDAHLRRILETAPAGTAFLIEVPSGNVWMLPPPADQETADYLRNHVYRQWSGYEFDALPVAVAPEGTSHTDMHGTSFARTILTPEKL
jgi:hypothetical protein